MPTRRERRERERESRSDSGEIDTPLATAEAQLEIESPSWDDMPISWDQMPAIVPPAEPIFMPDFGVERSRVSALEGATATTTVPKANPNAAWAATEQRAAVAPSPHTAGAWIIALMPLLQLLATLLFISAVGAASNSMAGQSNQIVLAAIWFAPYLITLPLAAADRRTLLARGYAKPASWVWAVLTGPVYLVARAISIVMQAGNGFGPILAWSAVALIQIGSIVAVPGLVISALPQVFSVEAERSILHDAAPMGTDFTVKCPIPPATIVGQQFTCVLTRSGGSAANSYNVTASLQRENGWIAWRVDDWGVYGTTQ